MAGKNFDYMLTICRQCFGHVVQMCRVKFGLVCGLPHVTLGSLFRKTRVRGRSSSPSGESFDCWINHPVSRDALRNALGKVPVVGYQFGSQVMPWGTGTKVVSRACMSEAGGRNECDANPANLVG